MQGQSKQERWQSRDHALLIFNGGWLAHLDGTVVHGLGLVEVVLAVVPNSFDLCVRKREEALSLAV